MRTGMGTAVSPISIFAHRPTSVTVCFFLASQIAYSYMVAELGGLLTKLAKILRLY
jgi:hypothetical protein